MSEADVLKRYTEKLVLCENVDPYTINMEESMNFVDLPKVTHMDIWNYFISSKSSYSHEEMNSYKGLEGHKFFESGFVRKIVCKQIPNNKVIVVGIVEHSQRINEPALKPWVLCKSGGTVIAAHCTCIAGLGEACSHVSAVLYGVEAMNRCAENKSKTDFLCQWNHPSTSTIDRFLPLAEMSFAKTERIGHYVQQQTEFDKDEIYDWVKENKEKTNKPAPLTLVIPDLNVEFKKPNMQRPKQDWSIATVSSMDEIANSYSTEDYANIIRQSVLNIFYNRKYQGMKLEELLDIAESIKLDMSQKDIKLIEELTKDQSDSWLWEKLRVGRITGSTFKLVSRTSIKKPSKTTILKICYPEKCRFSSQQTQYGKDHEPIARNAFVAFMRRNHTNFSCCRNGLIIDSLCNFFAVSPDGTCTCDCCGKYLVEIKCPFILSNDNSSINDLLGLNDPYLIFENNEYKINKKHLYFYQLQIQMAVCHLAFTYLYIWSPKVEINILVEFEPSFWQENSLKAFRFAKTVIVPELMNSYYTKTYAWR